eukprot:7346299-Prymnesium_polylepis.1
MAWSAEARPPHAQHQVDRAVDDGKGSGDLRRADGHTLGHHHGGGGGKGPPPCAREAQLLRDARGRVLDEAAKVLGVALLRLEQLERRE